MMRMVGLISGLFGVQLHGHGVLRNGSHWFLSLQDGGPRGLLWETVFCMGITFVN